MNRQAAVRRIAALMPPDLRAARAGLMLEVFAERAGMDEVGCPACGGSGWLDRPALEHCSICGGFHEVPIRLAKWFADRLSYVLHAAASGADAAPAACTSPKPVPDWVSAGTYGSRPGRLGEVVHRVHLEPQGVR
jgi:hypothetical protein